MTSSENETLLEVILMACKTLDIYVNRIEKAADPGLLYGQAENNLAHLNNVIRKTSNHARGSINTIRKRAEFMQRRIES